MDWVGYRVRLFELPTPLPPLPVVKDGKLLHRNTRRELVTLDELMSQLREQGVQELSQVKVEGDGSISVITHDQARHRARRRTIH